MAGLGMTALVGAQALGNFYLQGQQADATRRQGAYSRSLFDFNATLAEQAAVDATNRGTEEERRVRRRTSQLIGAQRAAAAAQGIDVASGSALDLQDEATYMGELDAETVRNNAAREAYGFRVQAWDQTTRGRLTEIAARRTAANQQAQAWSTLMDGAINTFDTWRQTRPSLRSGDAALAPRVRAPRGKPRVRDINPGRTPGVLTMPAPRASNPMGY